MPYNTKQTIDTHLNHNSFQYLKHIRLSSIASVIAFTLSFPALAQQPQLMKANTLEAQVLRSTYNEIGDLSGIDFLIKNYLISEKLDGVRAYWTGSELVTKSGKKIHSPSWFTQHFPSVPLDGELWLRRGHFQAITQIVLDHHPDELAWREVKYMAFDLPDSPEPFSKRYERLQQIISSQQAINAATFERLKIVEHKQVENVNILIQWLDVITDNHGEGLMLQHKDNMYTAGRTNQLLKLKQHQDAEAIVVGYEEGRGKFQGMMGSVWVKTAANQTFKIGTGFNNNQRQQPPAIGTTIQFRFNGYTDRGIPRFARFIRVRTSPDS